MLRERAREREGESTESRSGVVERQREVSRDLIKSERSCVCVWVGVCVCVWVWVWVLT